ncbi:MAG TPA: MFS transporter [Candidatus Methylomirabilis sp.]
MVDRSPCRPPGPVPRWALKAYLFLFFATVGVTEPYLNLYLRRLGFAGTEIGALAAIPPGVAALAPFVWTAWADATGRARAVFLWNTWLAGLCFVPVLLFRSFGLLASALTLFALVKAPLVPLANSLAFQALGPRREGFGRIRLWGSLGYIVAAVGGGAVADHIGVAPVLAGVAALLAGCGVVATASLGRCAPSGPAPLGAGLGDLLRGPGFRLFLGAAFLARLSAGPYNTFFTIQLDALGISQAVAGWAWAVGVACEVVVMGLWPRLVGRARPERLLAAAAGAHALRWWLTAGATHPAALLAVQGLHGLTFGVFYLASVQIVDERVRPGLRGAGQGLYAAWVFGVGGVAGNSLGGLLFDRVDLPGLYRLSALVALGATILCLRLRPPHGLRPDQQGVPSRG